MATYKRTFNEISGTQVTDKLALDETHLYGNSRIGLRDRSQDGIYTDVTYNYTAMNTDKSYHTTTTASTTHMAAVNTATPERKLGYKAYELVNHLGNVLVTVSDRKLIHTTSSVLDYYVADVKSANDYSAFGAPMPGRSYSSANYRYGFNGKENDPESVGTEEGLQDYGMRIYNPALARFLSVDPLLSAYPMLTPYQFASNTPIAAIDLDGLEASLSISMGTDVMYRTTRLETATAGWVQAYQNTMTQSQIDQVVATLKQVSNDDPEGILFLAIFSHGTPGEIYPGVPYDSGIHTEDLDKLETAIINGEIKFAPGAVIWLGGCNAGTTQPYYDAATATMIEGLSLAQRLANITGATVYAIGNSSCGPNGESNDEMNYGPVYPSEGSVFAYTKDQAPVDVGNNIGIVGLYNQTRMNYNANQIIQPIMVNSISVPKVTGKINPTVQNLYSDMENDTTLTDRERGIYRAPQIPQN